jgi:hypothetical protein
VKQKSWVLSPQRFADWAKQQDNLFKEDIESLVGWCMFEVEKLGGGDLRITYHPWENGAHA